MADLDRARDDFGAFSRELLGLSLVAVQRAVAPLRSVFTLFLAARQMGKSLVAVSIALWWAFRAPGSLVLLLGPSEEASKRLLATCRDLLARSRLGLSVVDESSSVLRLSNASTLRALSASESSARGWSADLLVVDEAQLVPESLLAAIIPTLSAREGSRVVMAGTASVASGTFYNLAASGLAGNSEHVTVHRWVPRLVGGDVAAPWLQPEVVEAARASMSPQRFAAEYLCEFASGADHVFNRAMVDAASADYETTPFNVLAPAARFAVGIDWGAHHDRTVAVAVGAFAGLEETVWGVASLRRFDAGHPLPQTVEEIAATPAHVDTLNAEKTGLGEGLAQYLWKAWRTRSPHTGGRQPRRLAVAREDVTELYPPARPRLPKEDVARPFSTRLIGTDTTAQLKAAGFGALRLMIERGKFLLPASETELRRELLLLRAELTDSGTEKISASIGHDDIVMALMLATVPYRTRDGEWHDYLADLGERRRPNTDVPAAMAGAQRVRSGSGIEVARTPVWQSVAGRELTVPESFAASRRVPRRIVAARERVAEAMQAIEEGSA